jgi:hypothetical protein
MARQAFVYAAGHIEASGAHIHQGGAVFDLETGSKRSNELAA